MQMQTRRSRPDQHIDGVADAYVSRLLDEAGHDAGLPALVCSPKALRARFHVRLALPSMPIAPARLVRPLDSAVQSPSSSVPNCLLLRCTFLRHATGQVRSRTSILAVTDASVDTSIGAVADHARPPDLLMTSDALGPVLAASPNILR